MPFTETTTEHTEAYWTDHYEDFLKPTIEEVGDIEVSRSEALHGDLINQIIFKLVNSDIVVADLTDSNPNVYWELGVRHSFKSGTIIIKEDGYKLPFDVSKLGILTYYPKNHTKNERLFVRQFRQSIKDCCVHPEFNDSHVLETISGRGSLYEIINKDEIIRKIEALNDEYIYNNGLYEEIYKDIDKNEKIRKEIKEYPENMDELNKKIYFPSNIVRTHSIELLLTTRYLSEKKEFYNNYGNIMDSINTIKEFASQWSESEEWVEKWLEKNKKNSDTNFKAYKQLTEYLINKYQK